MDGLICLVAFKVIIFIILLLLCQLVKSLLFTNSDLSYPPDKERNICGTSFLTLKLPARKFIFFLVFQNLPPKDQYHCMIKSCICLLF